MISTATHIPYRRSKLTFLLKDIFQPPSTGDPRGGEQEELGSVGEKLGSVGEELGSVGKELGSVGEASVSVRVSTATEGLPNFRTAGLQSDAQPPEKELTYTKCAVDSATPQVGAAVTVGAAIGTGRASRFGNIEQCEHIISTIVGAANVDSHVCPSISVGAATNVISQACPSVTSPLTYFIAHLSPMRSHIKHTLNTLDTVTSMLEISQRVDEETKILRGPSAWSRAQVVEFVEQLYDGRYKHLAPYFQNLTGRMLSVEWLGHLERRVVSAGGRPEDAAAIYDAFHELLTRHKQLSKPRSSSNSTSVFRGPPPPSLPLPPHTTPVDAPFTA